MVVSGIVQHQHHARVAGAMLQRRLQKGLERGRVERGAPRADDRAGAQTDGPKTGDRLAGGCMEEDRILDRGRHPHAAPGAMLLEVAFVHALEVFFIFLFSFITLFLFIFSFLFSISLLLYLFISSIIFPFLRFIFQFILTFLRFSLP